MFRGLLPAVLLGISALTAGSASAQNGCGVSLAQCDLQQDQACLERTYACGAYDRLLSTLFVEDLDPTLDQKFYMGASFFGMFLRERAAGLECEMAKQAREYLFDYLGKVDEEFTRTGQFGTVRQMRQIHSAAKMFERLSTVRGCPESALTRATVQSIARSEATRYATDVFLSPPAAVSDSYQTLQLALRGFVSKASDLETGLALRNAEIDASLNRLLAIRALFEEVFGGVTGAGATLAVDAAVLDALAADNAGRLRSVQIQQGNFSAALNGISLEDYAALRQETIATAQQFMKESAFHINMIGILMPTDPARPFPRLEDAVNAEGPGRQAREDYAQIKADWSEHGARTGICTGEAASRLVWYCR
jgi:hypothetical protein